MAKMHAKAATWKLFMAEPVHNQGKRETMDVSRHLDHLPQNFKTENGTYGSLYSLVDVNKGILSTFSMNLAASL